MTVPDCYVMLVLQKLTIAELTIPMYYRRPQDAQKVLASPAVTALFDVVHQSNELISHPAWDEYRTGTITKDEIRIDAWKAVVEETLVDKLAGREGRSRDWAEGVMKKLWEYVREDMGKRVIREPDGFGFWSTALCLKRKDRRSWHAVSLLESCALLCKR